MKKKIINLLVILSFAAILSLNIGVKDMQAQYIQKNQVQIKDGYPINANGETYGTDIRDSDVGPDLILTTSGGYIKQSDIDDHVETLEDALNYIKNQENIRRIPLYKSDGKTVIGEYCLGGM